MFEIYQKTTFLCVNVNYEDDLVLICGKLYFCGGKCWVSCLYCKVKPHLRHMIVSVNILPLNSCTNIVYGNISVVKCEGKKHDKCISWTFRGHFFNFLEKK